VKDTIGAGDSLVAALLAGLLAGREDAATLAQACRIGEWVAGHDGATPAYNDSAPRPGDQSRQATLWSSTRK
jgi:fructokinase